MRDAAVERSEELVDSGLEYRPGEPVVVRVVRRERRVRVGDDARAARLAGWSRVPCDLAAAIERAFVVNVRRRGEIFLPGERFIGRVAHASLALYEELLDRE